VSRESLPSDFLCKLDELERSYLAESDPIRQSGFGGGPARWRAEREPLLEGVDSAGEFLDIGCANGYLLECLMIWGDARGLTITPHGLDRSAALIELAKSRLPEYASGFHVGCAWEWIPDRRYRYVYSLHDCVPPSYLEEYVAHLLARAVAPGGRLILGAYGSRSRRAMPFDLRLFLESAGYRVAGFSTGGDPPVSLFTWVDKSAAR
jgi:SAM-dependent methyltransferase